MKKLLNLALMISFVLTVMVPLTGVHVHKMASAIFLLLSFVHTITYRKKLGAKRWLLLATILLSFATGLFGMILDHIPIVLIWHRAISIALVFFLAIHILFFIENYSLEYDWKHRHNVIIGQPGYNPCCPKNIMKCWVQSCHQVG